MATGDDEGEAVGGEDGVDAAVRASCGRGAAAVAVEAGAGALVAVLGDLAIATAG